MTAIYVGILHHKAAWCRGDITLLQRTAHQAVKYGRHAGCLLLHAGYKLSTDGQWVSDLVVINTRRHTPRVPCPLGKSPSDSLSLFLSCGTAVYSSHNVTAPPLAHRRTVQALRLRESSPEPAPRAYHTLMELDHYLVLFGGRNGQGLLGGEETLAAFDMTTKRWTLIGTHRHYCAWADSTVLDRRSHPHATSSFPHCCRQVAAHSRARRCQTGAAIAASQSEIGSYFWVAPLITVHATRTTAADCGLCV